MPTLHNRYFYLLAISLILTCKTGAAQTQKPQSNPPAQSSPQTRYGKVGAHLTPEEIEDGKINDAYQPLYHLKKPHDCAEIVTLCETKVIPMAEQSKFELTRNKFLFLANREIADCDLYAGKGEEAEKRYQKLFDFISVWPGKDDSDFPINYQSIGTARLVQGHWKEAEEALEKAITIFDDQIERATRSDSEFMRNEHSKNLKMSEAQARNYLAAAYFRDGRQSEAMEMLEKAYQEALQSNASAHLVQQIIDSGREASILLGDKAAKAKWDARTTSPK